MNNRLRSAGGWALLAGMVLITALLVALGTAHTGRGTRLDPGNPAPEGGQALSQILAAHGVQVHRVTRSDQMLSQASDGATVLVTRSSTLATRQWDRLRRVPGPLVLVEPDDPTLGLLAPAITTADTAGDSVLDPQCSAPDAQDAGAALAGHLLYEPRAGTNVTVCYPSPGDPGNPSRGSYLVADQGERAVTVIGQGDVLTNGALGHEGNAALALGTLGDRSDLVWYLPDPLESGQIGERQSLRELLPPVVWWVLVQLGLVVLLIMLWRGRRMGRLVSEPLPVVVQAAETQLGRARLYRQAHARGRAADTLRTAALRRLAHRLSAPDSATPGQLVQLVAEAVGRPEQEVGRVLLGPPPQSDLELVELADQLDQLEDLHPTVSAGERQS
jgi:hypothetical protein